MSDRFRFRAWISCEGKFSDSVCVFADGSFRAGLHTCEDYEIVYLDDEAILMQCTGLRDRNGKLIYEGDVVRICWRVDPAIYVVKMVQRGSSGFPMWQFSDPHDSRFYSGSGGCDAEVIGNIHEHPELVEG